MTSSCNTKKIRIYKIIPISKYFTNKTRTLWNVFKIAKSFCLSRGQFHYASDAAIDLMNMR